MVLQESDATYQLNHHHHPYNTVHVGKVRVTMVIHRTKGFQPLTGISRYARCWDPMVNGTDRAPAFMKFMLNLLMRKSANEYRVLHTATKNAWVGSHGEEWGELSLT